MKDFLNPTLIPIPTYKSLRGFSCILSSQYAWDQGSHYISLIICNLTLHFGKSLFPSLNPWPPDYTDNSYHCTKAPLPHIQISNKIKKLLVDTGPNASVSKTILVQLCLYDVLLICQVANMVCVLNNAIVVSHQKEKRHAGTAFSQPNHVSCADFGETRIKGNPWHRKNETPVCRIFSSFFSNPCNKSCPSQPLRTIPN